MYPEFDYGYDFGTELAEMVEMLLFIYGAIFLIAAVVGLITYLLTAIGVYKMSRTLGLPNAWFAFVPIANTYALGRIAEQCPTSSGKRPLHYGRLLLIFQLLSVVTVAIGGFAMVKSITDLIFSGALEDLLADYMFGYGYMSYPGGAVLEDNLLKISLIATMMSTALWIIGILQIVFTYIALYKMYKLFNPNSAVAFLVVSILFNITQPFFIFSLRNRMPCYATAQPGGYPSYPQYPQYNDPPTGYAAPNAEPQAEPYATATVSAAVSEAVENIESPEEQQEAAAEDPWNRPE